MLLVQGVFFNPQIRKAFLSTPSGMKNPHPLPKQGVPVSILKRDIRAVPSVDNTVDISTVAAAFKEFNSELNDKEHSWLAHTSMFARSVLSADPKSKPFHVSADITVVGNPCQDRSGNCRTRAGPTATADAHLRPGS